MDKHEGRGLTEFLDDRLEYGRQPYGGGLILPVKVIAGVMVMAIIYFMGSVSIAHLNPAVTWAFALRGKFRGAACRVTLWRRRSGRSWRACSCSGRPA
jgi:glycerol uptake facilitator-like aquaporin